MSSSNIKVELTHTTDEGSTTYQQVEMNTTGPVVAAMLRRLADDLDPPRPATRSRG